MRGKAQFQQHTTQTIMEATRFVTTKQYYPKTKNKQNLQETIAEWLSSNLSWSKWIWLRKQNQQPILKNELTAIKSKYLQRSTLHIHSLRFATGAFIKLIELYDQLVKWYEHFDGIFPSPYKPQKVITWRISMDNRKLFGANEGFFLAPIDVAMIHSPPFIFITLQLFA